MADFLYEHAPDNRPVDLLLHDYVRSQGIKMFELVPNLVQHIGLYSSSGAKNRGTAKWMKVSTTFEDDSIRIS